VPRRERLGPPDARPGKFLSSHPIFSVKSMGRAAHRPARRADVTMPANRIAPFLPLFRGGRYLWSIGKLVARASATAPCRPLGTVCLAEEARRRRAFRDIPPTI
jgi:hypothetical protein